MATRMVVPIDDEFSRLSEDERVRRTTAWFAMLGTREPVVLPVSAAEAVAEVRAEMGW